MSKPGIEVEGAAHWRELLIRAYARFHEVSRASEAPSPGLVPYTAADVASETKGDIIWGWGVPTEVRETINSVNSWSVHLRNWGIWNEVLADNSSEADQWDISAHFIEPIAFFCMLQPASVSERMVVASETAMHHANRLVFPDEPDRLDQDDLKPNAVLRKKDRRKQLERLGSRWTAFQAFFDALSELDGKAYRDETRNFRDLSAHSFAPRLHIGHVSRAIRSYAAYKELIKQTDGTFELIPHPTKKSVGYAMSDAPPLDLRMARQSNLVEFSKAQKAMDCLTELIKEICAKIPA